MRAELVEAVRSAWGFDDDDPIELGTPRTAWTTYPQAAIYTNPVEREFVGPRIVEESYLFEIEGRFPLPSDGTLDDLKLDRARELGELLCPPAVEGSTIASPSILVSGCFLPHVSTVDFGSDEDSDSYYSVRLAFSVRCHVLQ